MANTIKITGTVVKEFYTFPGCGENERCRFYMHASRTSGNVDKIPCACSEGIKRYIISRNLDFMTDRITVVGEIQTMNVNHHLILYVRVDGVFEAGKHDENVVDFDGYICSSPIYRETPFGRKITDAIVASNSDGFPSAYIPSIFWGGNAVRAGRYKIGVHIKGTGRLQSRVYEKELESGEREERTTYELSVSRMQVVFDERKKKCKKRRG